MAKQRIDKIFAENLGIALGGCVRDQSVTLLNKDVPKLVGAPFCPIPLIGSAAKREFRLVWAGALQGMALWAVRDRLEEFNDEKLCRKVVFNMQDYADEALGKPLLRKVDADVIERYNRVRNDFMRLGRDKKTTKETFGRALFREFNAQGELEGDKAMKLAIQIGLALNLFDKIVDVMVKSPGSYTRSTVKQKDAA